MWVCRLPVHIGPLGSCRLVADSHKNRCSLRVDRVVRPYGDMGRLKSRRRGRRLLSAHLAVADLPKILV